MVRTRRLQRNRVFSSMLSFVLMLSFVFVATPVSAKSKLSKLNGDIIVSKKRFDI